MRIVLTDLSGAWQHDVEGIGSEDEFTVLLPSAGASPMRLRLENLDADLSRHLAERTIDLAPDPRVVAEPMPSSSRLLWHRYGAAVLD